MNISKRLTWFSGGVRWLALLAVLAALSPWTLPLRVEAAETTVTTCDETTFDAALNAAQAAGEGIVAFDCAGTIGVSNTKTISTDVTIIGNGGVALDGGQARQIFFVESAAKLTLIDITLQHGRTSGYGGAVQNNGTLRVEDSTFLNSRSQDGGGAIGAFSGGSVTVIRSTFIGNQAQRGGAIYYAFNGPSLQISASTFFNNAADQDQAQENDGGALFIDGGTVMIESTTIVGNEALDSAGGVRVSSNANVTITRSIVANNEDRGTQTDESCKSLGTLQSGGYNLNDEDSCGFTATGDIQNSATINIADPADNGGPTLTMALETGSDALNAAACNLASTGDQRGAPRPLSGTQCDIGAYEAGAIVPVRMIAAYQSNSPSSEAQETDVYAVATGPTGISFNYQVDCDDNGSYETAATGAGTLGRASCGFNDDGSYTVGVQVCDAADSGDCDTGAAVVTVLNVAPSIAGVADDGPVGEGSPITLTVDASDVAGINDPLTYGFDCDNDGTYETAGSGSMGVCTFAEDGVYTVAVLVEDDDGGLATDSVEVSVTNVDPTITNLTNTGPIDEGSDATITIAATDPAGINDPLTYGFDCDNDGSYESEGSAAESSCSFAEDGTFTVGVQVQDDDGGATTSSTLVVVNNVAPVVEVPHVDPSSSNEGQSVVASATFSDVGVEDTHTCTVDYGDGSESVDGTVSNFVCTGPAHIYVDDNPSGFASANYTVTITVKDDDGDNGERGVIQTVSNVAPVINGFSTNGPIEQGGPATISVFASDVGLEDPLSYRFDCDNDGSYETAGAGNKGTCELEPSAATSTIGVEVRDDDLGVTIDSVVVGQVLTLCASYWNGALTSPGVNGCGPSTVTLVLPATPTTLCINMYTKVLSWSRTGVCGSGQLQHKAPADGPLHYCSNPWTGGMRAILGSGLCSAAEIAGVIPG